VHIVPLWFQNPGSIYTITRLFWPDWEVFGWPKSPGWFATWPHLHGLLVSVVGLLVAGGITWGVRLLGYFVLRREALGFGDVILMAVIGSFLGWQPALIAFVLAPAFAIVALPIQLLAHRDKYIPYGPYLSLGALATLMGFRWLWGGTGGWGGFGGIFELGPLFVVILLFMAVLFLFTLILVQGGKRLIGLRDHDDEPPPVWTAADQSQYQAGERVDPEFGLWRTNGWPGRQSGRGMLHADRWRHNGHQR
jgi:leader peptidase (prepilin peptidase)/N-methyltransferase